jgi:hypothetical protein
MGLDIVAYKQLQPTPNTNNRREWFLHLRDEQLHVHFRKEQIEDTEKDFPGRTAGLFPGIYSWATGHSFRVGYGGFNDWRRDLAKFVGTTYEDVIANRQPIGTPFVELINFYDNEGVIGPLVSAKLAADFVNNSSKYSDWLRDRDDDDEYGDNAFDDLALYLDWTIAFIFAGDHGAVQFG